MTAKDSPHRACHPVLMRKAHPKRPHLRAWRLHFEKTQEWLAERIGRDQSSVNRAEKGLAGVDDQTFAEIARVYGITEAELSAPPADAAKARELHNLLETVRHLSSSDVQMVAAFAARLKAR